MRKVSEYEQHAEECRGLVFSMKDPTHKRQLMEMAEAWVMVAEERAKQIGQWGQCGFRRRLHHSNRLLRHRPLVHLGQRRSGINSAVAPMHETGFIQDIAHIFD
jgi:hypothetical protein